MDSYHTVRLESVSHAVRQPKAAVSGTHLDHPLNVGSDAVTAVCVRLVVGIFIDLEQFQHLALIDPGLASNLGQALVCLIPALVRHTGVEEISLLLEQGGAEVPEFLRGDLEHSGSGFMGQS